MRAFFTSNVASSYDAITCVHFAFLSVPDAASADISDTEQGPILVDIDVKQLHCNAVQAFAARTQNDIAEVTLPQQVTSSLAQVNLHLREQSRTLPKRADVPMACKHRQTQQHDAASP
jgi:hypothetical protein